MRLDAKPVVIVGAGPVGLLLALLLGRQNIPCVLVDKRQAQPDWSRAIGVTPPSLSILKAAGVYSLIREHGIPIERARVFDGDREIGHLDFTGLPTEFQFILSVPQSETMSILTEALRRLKSVIFCPGLELRALNPQEDGVEVLLAPTGKTEAIRLDAEWVMGCDGSDSTTRALAGIPFSRRPYPQSFVMGDFLDGTGWGAEARLYFTPEGSIESFPLPEQRRRWVVLRTRESDRKPVDFLAEQVARVCGERLKGEACADETIFTPEHLLAETYWKGRVILAGDAAHVMCPIGGQGMNVGFADADYLASILPLLNDPAHRNRLLENYARNRRDAFRLASLKAASGMWLGTRLGRRQSAFRSLFFHWALHTPAVSSNLSRHFAMVAGNP